MLAHKVSFVMPTYNRPKYAQMAIRCFLQQTYWNVELVIVNDGEPIQLPDTGSRIIYTHLKDKTTTGTKRNIGAEIATGDIIANLDDDDWSSAHRLEDQVQRLISSNKAVTGYNASILYDEKTDSFYKIKGGPPYFASGTSQCYWKEWWQKFPYPDVSFGEDSVFSRIARLADELAISEPGKMMVVRRHDNNTSEVFLPKLQQLSHSDVSPEFFRAQESLSRFHFCSRECRANAEQQFKSPVIEYHVSSLPEVVVR